MRRKITVYGLRFSKTTFWNRLNTGFPDPAVATVLTACGIETIIRIIANTYLSLRVATVLTACGIETPSYMSASSPTSHKWLQQYLPLAVLKLICVEEEWQPVACCNSTYRLRY